ncbi:coniferyl aldehyde dehydrogenase [Salinivibrio sp. MA607]|uniref:coniferyl aldehyde dehydrogenase n=1 Tax=Salinivibrio sp. MA607 TaxID=1909457 RepID=UPI0009898FEC|nr:coniferyl aldehyde dehydrogenase [Salinivibrio sp. MA607]OOF03273.1 coniferyl-aldehyde dehydrogenase [Salinivibrio sp. MA607]
MSESSYQWLERVRDMRSVFERQKAIANQDAFPDYTQRIESLKRLRRAIKGHHNVLQQALSDDYGHRAFGDTEIADILPLIHQIDYTRRRLKRWMKPQKRRPGITLLGTKLAVHQQPKGVVGIVVPWNFPIMLAVSPLICALAAGNRVMLKLSEFTPNTNRVLRELIADVFSPKEVAVIEGEVEVSRRFTELEFDHLFFTGSTQVGRQVMLAAADNLTPVTLELGGKSPVIIDDKIDMDVAVSRLIYGKCLNAGQICVAPDYVLCPEHRQEAFIHAYQQAFRAMYPDFEANQDYSQIVNQTQVTRLEETLQDALDKGARRWCALDQKTIPTAEKRCWPTQLLTHVTDDMRVMQEEVFGPLLPIVTYQDFAEALHYIQARPRPLALYLMSNDAEKRSQVTTQLHAGGMGINETLFHVAAEDAPFGGIGDSGMGHYHGIEGFYTFSHSKTVLTRDRWDTSFLVKPPYNRWYKRLMRWWLMR